MSSEEPPASPSAESEPVSGSDASLSTTPSPEPAEPSSLVCLSPLPAPLYTPLNRRWSLRLPWSTPKAPALPDLDLLATLRPMALSTFARDALEPALADLGKYVQAFNAFVAHNDGNVDTKVVEELEALSALVRGYLDGACVCVHFLSPRVRTNRIDAADPILNGLQQCLQGMFITFDAITKEDHPLDFVQDAVKAVQHALLASVFPPSSRYPPAPNFAYFISFAKSVALTVKSAAGTSKRSLPEEVVTKVHEATKYFATAVTTLGTLPCPTNAEAEEEDRLVFEANRGYRVTKTKLREDRGQKRALRVAFRAMLVTCDISHAMGGEPPEQGRRKNGGLPDSEDVKGELEDGEMIKHSRPWREIYVDDLCACITEAVRLAQYPVPRTAVLVSAISRAGWLLDRPTDEPSHNTGPESEEEDEDMDDAASATSSHTDDEMMTDCGAELIQRRPLQLLAAHYIRYTEDRKSKRYKFNKAHGIKVKTEEEDDSSDDEEATEIGAGNKRRFTAPEGRRVTSAWNQLGMALLRQLFLADLKRINILGTTLEAWKERYESTARGKKRMRTTL